MNKIEKQVYSQHGEDGIIEFIISHLKNPKKTFLEIGYGNGRQNNSLNLSKNFNWSGVGIDARKQDVSPPPGVKIINKFISLEDIEYILNLSGKDIDFYSVDIDSIDYWLTIKLLDFGLNPAFVCVEIMNGAGAKISVAPPINRPGFKYNKHHICGASISAWKNLWRERGYEFLTVDSSGINAFFYKPELFYNEIKDYPSISFIKSKKNISFETWKSFFSKRASIESCIVTGRETSKDIINV